MNTFDAKAQYDIQRLMGAARTATENGENAAAFALLDLAARKLTDHSQNLAAAVALAKAGA